MTDTSEPAAQAAGLFFTSGATGMTGTFRTQGGARFGRQGKIDFRVSCTFGIDNGESACYNEYGE